ncbi:MAG TPA: NIPSNAP family protein [Bryobacteraceae bacterium]|nr:NIPSNAP family protein [Bryobacteraceae bacterium]
MNRRDFLATTGGLTLSLTASAAEGKPRIIELRRFQLRNNPDAMVRRTGDFLEKGWGPALKRSGATVVGAFSSVVAEGSPFALLVAEYPDLATWEAANTRALADTDSAKVREDYLNGPLGFVRSEVKLLRSFPGFPTLQVPEALPGGKTRLYELRTYESNNAKTLARKIRMFDEGEHALFAKVGMTNVFFGETIAGPDMPNLAYLVGYEDMADREKVWATFVSHPEWKKMLAQPGVSDAEIVSNISNALLRPASWSAIR